MILVALFGLIFIIVISLNFYDSYNLNKIEQYYKSNSCTSYYEHKGIFKGICKDSIIVIKNSFSPDLKTPSEEIKYDTIQALNTSVTQKTQTTEAKYFLIVNIKNNTKKVIIFTNEARLNDFKSALQKKVTF